MLLQCAYYLKRNRFNLWHTRHQSRVKQQRAKLRKQDSPRRLLCSTKRHKTRFVRLPPHFGHTPSHTVTRFLVFSEVASASLSIVWAPVLHTEAYRHRLEAAMIDEVLRHSPERAPSKQSACASCQAHRHPKTMWCISHRARFFPRTRGSKPMWEGGTFSLCSNPISSHELSAAIPSAGRIET